MFRTHSWSEQSTQYSKIHLTTQLNLKIFFCPSQSKKYQKRTPKLRVVWKHVRTFFVCIYSALPEGLMKFCAFNVLNEHFSSNSTHLRKLKLIPYKYFQCVCFRIIYSYIFWKMLHFILSGDNVHVWYSHAWQNNMENSSKYSYRIWHTQRRKQAYI